MTNHDEFKCNVIANDGFRPATKSKNVWGVAFYARSPWPEKMCIQDYDAAPHGDHIRFDVENGFAEYEIVGRCEYGGAYHGRLLTSEWRA